MFFFWNNSICLFAEHPFSILYLRFNLLIVNLLLKKYLSLWTMLLSFVKLLLYLFFWFSIVWGKFELVSIRNHFHLGICLWTRSVLNIEFFHLFSKISRSRHLTKLKHFNHLCWQQPIYLPLFILFFVFTINKSNIGNFFYNISKLLKTHFLVTLWVFLESFNQETPIEVFLDLTNLKVLAEHHELVDSHDCSFVFDLFECRIVSSCVTDFAIMLENHPKVVLVFFRKRFQWKFVCTDCCILIFIVFQLSLNLFRTVFISVCLDSAFLHPLELVFS